MKDTPHRFADRASMPSVTDLDPEIFAVDVIGIYTPLVQIGTHPETGEALMGPGTPAIGWHVNLRRRDDVELPEAWQASLIPEPVTPWRVFV